MDAGTMITIAWVMGAASGWIAAMIYLERKAKIVQKVHDKFTQPPTASELFKEES